MTMNEHDPKEMQDKTDPQRTGWQHHDAAPDLEVITITDELSLLNTGEPDELTQLTLSVSAYGRR